MLHTSGWSIRITASCEQTAESAKMFSNTDGTEPDSANDFGSKSRASDLGTYMSQLYNSGLKMIRSPF